MGTDIEWCDETWNPITGCTPISEGCRNCFAKRFAGGRLRGRYGYPAKEPFRVTFHPNRVDDPLKWKKPRRVFVESMGDPFHKDVPLGWLDEIHAVIERCEWHTFMILTKRPERMNKYYEYYYKHKNYLPNLWLGVSVENQLQASRITWFIDTPIEIRFVSVEPMLGPVDIIPWIEATYCSLDSYRPVATPGINWLSWVICGAETGPGARYMDPAWARDLRDQCKAAGVPFFFKKMSGKAPIPEDLQIREFPNVTC